MRTARIERKTYETQIKVEVQLDGTGQTEIATGIGFFDHMLTHIGKHSFMDLKIEAKGDLEIDGHHTVEDVGLALGQAIRQALGDRVGINRYGDRIVPMDEALILCALDLSGRPYLTIDTPFRAPMVGSFDTQLVEEFFRALSVQVGMNLHVQVLRGINDHHIIEGMCKAFAKALGDAISLNPRVTGVLSTKGVLEV